MKKMPVLFVGHGSPMNAIEDNAYTQVWAKLAKGLPKPEAILVISAHWYTRGSRIMDEAHPKMIYDMYGFPDALYQVMYKAKGAPELARHTQQLIGSRVKTDNSWGYDHGAWSVLVRMYPEADIPVYQLSVDEDAPAQAHFEIGQAIAALRNEGVLILGSGNVVHNLARINWGMAGGYPWAQDFDKYIRERVVSRQFDDVIHHQRAGSSAAPAFTTPDHFFPLLYVLGASDAADHLTVFNNECLMGSMSMTGYLFE